MYYSFVLVGLLSIVNGYTDNIEDRYYFELILRELWRYPILKQTLIRLCSKELDKCKNEGILRTYTNIINHDDNLQKKLDNLINCFMDSQTCFQDDDWQQWSEWSSCSVTCGRGRILRKRSCKPDRQCLIGSIPTQSNDCFTNSCTNDDQKHLNDIVTYYIDHKLAKNNFNIIFIFFFPLFFTILCIPLCAFYYIYEFDFKIHALTIHILSICNRCCEIKRSRINIS